MDKILINGKIYVDKDNFQEAMWIKDGIIAQVGTNEEILKNDADSFLDLGGRTVLPGLNDSHMHLTMVGEGMNTLGLNGARSVEDVINLGREFLNEHPELTALYGRGWNQDFFTKGEKRLLNRHDLDQISTEIPVVLSRVCGHVVSANTRAMEVLSIDENTFVDGGTVELGEDGNPNGVFNENATKLILNAIPDKSYSQRESEFLAAADYAIKNGITSVQSCDVMSGDFQPVFEMIHNIYNEKKTSLRYGHQFNFQDIADFKRYLETEFHKDNYDEKFLSKGALKLFKDGSLGARTALMRKEYEDAPGTLGVAALSDEQLQALYDLATENGIRAITHAIGDGAAQSVINAIDSTMKNGENSLRHGIVHLQITSFDQLQRIADLNIPIMYQPIFLDYDINIVEDRVGKELASTSYAFNSLYNLGAPVSLGTDSPVEDLNPFPNIYCAVTRKTIGGHPEDGFNPKECMSVEDAIDAYTIGSAFNEFKENFKGRLKPGYVADLIVLDRDIFTIAPDEIKDIKVDRTMIDGEFVYIK